MPSLDEVRTELRSILTSQGFRQSPRLVKLLQYICSQALVEEPGQVTEYTIALDVLGKPQGFKDSKDSVVRVEVHRLRKRLAQFYEQEGASHPLKILIPPGQYVPEFQISDAPSRLERQAAVDDPAKLREEESSVEERDIPAVCEVVEPPEQLVAALPAETGWAPSEPAAGKGVTAVFAASRLRLGAVLLLMCLVAGGFLLVSRTRSGLREDRPRESTVPPAVSETAEIRILAGLQNGTYADVWGNTWQHDRYFRGGVSRSGPSAFVSQPPDAGLFRTMREGVSTDDEIPPPRRAFSYDIPVRPGVYELRLYFADPVRQSSILESRQGGENMRRFTINLNGRPILQQFDAIADAGFAAVGVRAFKDVVPAADGMVHLQFLPDPHRPFVNAIELLPGTPGKLKPIRLCAHQSAYADPEATHWSADNFFIGGRVTTHPHPDDGPALAELYTEERYGNFAYAIPVPPGIYTVRLHFAETLFGPFAPSTICRGPGCRVFDVTCNGVALLRDFDVFQTAGGAFLPVVRSFHGLRPNGQGKLLLSFSPSVNYAEVRAIEVIEE